MANGLTLKQQRFIDAYLGEAKGNGTAAARSAGYADPMQEAYRLLRNAEIRARIDERLAIEAMSSAEVLAELAAIGRAGWENFRLDVTDYKGTVVGSRLELRDKVKALELLGKYHQLFTDNVHHTGTLTLADLLSAGPPPTEDDVSDPGA